MRGPLRRGQRRQEWFNRNHQLYGRRLQLVAIRADRYDENPSSPPSPLPATATTPSGSSSPGFGAIDLGPARGLVTFATDVDDVAEVWWDPEALAYRYTRDARRFRPRELDADTSRYFQEGTTRADR